MKSDNSFKDNVLNRIKSEKVKMRPKLYFVVRPILFVFVMIMTLVIVIYFLSFIFFIFRINEGWALTVFGFRGLSALFLSLPWGLISFILMFLVVVETLLFRFSLIYRKPVLYSLLGLIVLVMVISFFVSATSIHDSMLLRNKNRALPWMGPLYEGYERIEFKNIHCGKVLGVTENGLVVEFMDDPSCTEVRIEVPPDFTKHKDLKIGDIVILVGRKDGSTMKLIDLTIKDSGKFCNRRVWARPVLR